MLCQNCPVREQCQTPCDALLQDLLQQETYLRETPVDPEILQEMIEAQQDRTEDQLSEESCISEDIAEKIPRLHKILPELLEPQRLCLYLRFWKGQSIGEISKTIGFVKGAVFHRINCALKQIKTDLEKEVTPSDSSKGGEI